MSSARGIVYGYFESDFKFKKNEKYFEIDDECEMLDASELEEYSRKIMIINSYPAMLYPQIPESVKYVIINTYHSGTLNTKSQSTIDFLKSANARGIQVYVTGISDGAQYSSAKAFDKLSILPIKNLSPVSAYVKLWLITTMKKDPAKFMQRSISGDIVR